MLSPSPDKGSPLHGYFQKTNGLLHGSNGFDLLVRTRQSKKTTNAKTSLFLLLVDQQTKGRKYISSLWQTRVAGVHEFEFNGVRYSVNLDSPRPYIHPVCDVRQYNLVDSIREVENEMSSR